MTQHNDNYIISLVSIIKDIAVTIEISVVHKPALMIMKFKEQFHQFRNHVFVLTNSVQQLQYRLLAIDSLLPAQLDNLH